MHFDLSTSPTRAQSSSVRTTKDAEEEKEEEAEEKPKKKRIRSILFGSIVWPVCIVFCVCPARAYRTTDDVQHFIFVTSSFDFVYH